MRWQVLAAALIAAFGAQASAQDAEGCGEHPAVSRYPETTIAWCEQHNYLPFRVPLGPVTGYRAIGEWDDVEGRVNRVLYVYEGDARTHAEIYANYKEALAEGGFEILAEGMFPNSQVSGAVGGRGWQDVYFRNNRWTEGGAVAMMVAGTSSSGGSGALVGKKERASDVIYAIVNVEQHADETAAVLVDIVETKPAETGLVTADADAMGRDLEEKGRTVLDGLFFEHDEAALMPTSEPALLEIVKVLEAHPDTNYYIVGHTDGTGTHAYNMQLSAARAEAVRSALINAHGVASARLQAAGVGPLVPVFSNGSEDGRAANRRVELVEQ